MKKITLFAAVMLMILYSCSSKNDFLPIDTSCKDDALTAYTYDELKASENIVFNESLVLINQTHPISEDDVFDVSEYKETDVYMNSCMHSDYSRLSADISEKFSEKLFVMSAYRTKEEQQQAIDEEGENAAGLNESEHRAGLALDVYVKYYAGAAFLQTDTGKYVNSECYKYGFIIRYPKYGEDITGIGFEPWHIRYVGYPHAEIIMQNKLTLEEYISGFELGKFYRYGDYIITKQDPKNTFLPNNFESAVISSDNDGNIIVTLFSPLPG